MYLWQTCKNGLTQWFLKALMRQFLYFDVSKWSVEISNLRNNSSHGLKIVCTSDNVRFYREKITFAETINAVEKCKNPGNSIEWQLQILYRQIGKWAPQSQIGFKSFHFLEAQAALEVMLVTAFFFCRL